MNQHVTDLAKAVETELSLTFRPRLDALADQHRREIALGKQLIAHHKRDLKATISAIREDRKSAKAAYEAELARLAEAEADAKEQTAEAIASETELLAYNQAALDALPE